MGYHSKNGREFVGVRTFLNGRRQVVYDAVAGKRVILEIGDAQASDPEIDEALREGVKSRNVLSGVLQALHRRNIRFDFPG